MHVRLGRLATDATRYAINGSFIGAVCAVERPPVSRPSIPVSTDHFRIRKRRAFNSKQELLRAQEADFRKCWVGLAAEIGQWGGVTAPRILAPFDTTMHLFSNAMHPFPVLLGGTNVYRDRVEGRAMSHCPRRKVTIQCWLATKQRDRDSIRREDAGRWSSPSPPSPPLAHWRNQTNACVRVLRENTRISHQTHRNGTHGHARYSPNPIRPLVSRRAGPVVRLPPLARSLASAPPFTFPSSPYSPLPRPILFAPSQRPLRAPSKHPGPSPWRPERREGQARPPAVWTPRVEWKPGARQAPAARG